MSSGSELHLDRMSLDDVGYDSRMLAEEIRRQLDAPMSYIDIRKVALALDITEIKEKPLPSFEGGLLTDAERSYGKILVNSNSGDRRRRFTIAHELLHFLNDRHVQTEGGFLCSSSDIGQGKSPAGTAKHQRQEREANRFAIELLAPRARFELHVDQEPNLEVVLDLSKDLKLSKEACARRYVELHEARLALVTHQNDVVRYAERSGDFPRLMLKQGSLMPRLDRASDLRGLGDVYLDDAKLWFDGPPMADLAVQTLFQKKGFGITLLTLSDDDQSGGSDIEDTFDRYTRWN